MNKSATVRRGAMYRVEAASQASPQHDTSLHDEPPYRSTLTYLQQPVYIRKGFPAIYLQQRLASEISLQLLLSTILLPEQMLLGVDGGPIGTRRRSQHATYDRGMLEMRIQTATMSGGNGTLKVEIQLVDHISA